MALNGTLNQIDLIDIHRTFYPNKAKSTSFSNAHGSFSMIDLRIKHKTSLNKFKKIEIISSIFSDHNGLELESNHMEKTQKHSPPWRLNNMLLNNEWFNNEIKKKNPKVPGKK